MSNKRKINVILMLATVAVVCLALSACVLQCEHVFDGKFISDGTHHWQQCVKCKQLSVKAEHVFSNWTVTVQPTADTDGSRQGACDLCGTTVTQVMPAFNSPNHVHSYVGDWQKDVDGHWRVCACGNVGQKVAHRYSVWDISVQPTSATEGEKFASCDLCGNAVTEVIQPTNVNSNRNLQIFAVNDFHGQADKFPRIAGYLNSVKDGNTILVSSGDMLQGSMESNSNYGQMLTECIGLAGFDCFTLGNHEFDWGLDVLRNLYQNSPTAFLGANIFKWDQSTRTWGEHAGDIAQEYAVKVTSNGLKVGIIGVIGKDQITSTSSQLVQTIGYKDPAKVIPELSQKLREELHCDFVIVSAHAGQDTFLNNRNFDITDYADAVFCAHTHQRENTKVNGVPFIQAGGYGNYIGKANFVVNGTGTVNCKEYGDVSFAYGWPIDKTTFDVIDGYYQQIAEEANQSLGISDGQLDKNEAIPRLVSRAMANYAVSQGYDIVLAMSNVGRTSINQGVITYSELYEAIPFDNVVYIAKVSGYDIHREARYDSNSIWRVSDKPIENSNQQYYYIAVLDYLLYHQDSNRNYNYFPSAFGSGFDPIPLTKEGYQAYNYRFITRDFLLANPDVQSADYVTKNNYTNKSLLGNQVTLATQTTQNLQYAWVKLNLLQGAQAKICNFVLPFGRVKNVA